MKADSFPGPNGFGVLFFKILLANNQGRLSGYVQGFS
jgi:hypothetical protein